MSKLPVVRGRELIRALERDGWYISATTAHIRMRHPVQSGFLIIPNHPSATIPAGTLRSILKMAGMSIDRFRELL
jgi:predicted RNA binding protein YcfA (HicA-like mRNA interferase family)